MRPSSRRRGLPSDPPSGPSAARRRRRTKPGSSSSPHLDAGHGHRPVLPRGLERGDRLAARLQRSVEALRVRGVLDHRDDRGGFVERVEHRVVVFVQLVEFCLLDLDRRADAGVAAFRVTHLRLEAFDREDDVPDALEALDLPVHRHLVPDGLEVPADALQLIRELDAEQVVRGADVLSPPVAGVAGDHQLDLLEQSSVLFNAVADVGHGRFSPSASPYVLPGYVFRGVDGSPGAFRGSPQGERRPLAFDHATGRPVDDDEHLLPLVRVLHEPHGGMEQLAIVRRRVYLDRFEVVDARLRLLLRELVGERRGLGLRLRLCAVAALHVDAAGLALVEVHLALQLELESVVRLVLHVSAHRDDRDVVLHLDAVPDPDHLRLRVDRLVPVLRARGGGRHRQGEQRRTRGFLRAGIAVGHHADARTRSDVLRPLEVGDHGGRDDPVRNIAEGDLTDVRAFRDLAAEETFVQPLATRLEGGLVREFVFQHVVLLDHFGRAAGAHRRHGAAICTYDQGEAGPRGQRRAARATFQRLRHRRSPDLLHGGVRVVRLAHRRPSRDARSRNGIAGSRRYAGCDLRRGDDALAGATKVTEHRAVRDTSTALIAEQGETSYSGDEASSHYLRISV